MKEKVIILGLLLIIALENPTLGADVPSSPLSVSLTAMPNPVASKGYVLYTYQVGNTGTESLTLMSMVDERYGDLSRGIWQSSPCRIPQTLAPGGSYSCQTIIVVYGSAGEEIANTLTVQASVGSNLYSGSASAVVRIASPLPIPPMENLPPEMHSITVDPITEGQEAQFIAQADDPDGDDLSYEWSLDGVILDCTAATNIYRFGDDGTYALTVTVNDGDAADSLTVPVTVTNANPSINNIAVDIPESSVTFPLVDTIQFSGSFTDPGWLDVHTATWDFGDGHIKLGTVTELPSLYATVGTVVTEHVYAAPGDYTVRLQIADDDGGTTTSTVLVHIASAKEALRSLSEYIQGIDAASFSGKVDQRKNALANKFSALEKMIDSNDWNGFINSLHNDIRAKADGQIDGKSDNDWIAGYDIQNQICTRIDDLASYINTLQ